MTIHPFHYFDPAFPDQAVIVYAPTHANDCPTVSITNYQYSYSPQENQCLNRDAIAKKELLASVRLVDETTGVLTVCQTDYPTWKTAATTQNAMLFQQKEDKIPNALHVQALIQTADNKLIFGPRPQSDQLQLPSGMLNWEDLQQPNALTYAAVREFNEECVNLPVQNPSMLGTLFYQKRVLTSVSITGQIDMTAKQLDAYRIKHQTEIKDFKKFNAINYIDSSMPAIEQAISVKQLNCTALAALLLFGRQKFGQKWLFKHCPKQIIFSKKLENFRSA